MSGKATALASHAPKEQEGLIIVKVEDENYVWGQDLGLQGNASSQETFRQRFRQLGYSDSAGPREALSRLRQLCRVFLLYILRIIVLDTAHGQGMFWKEMTSMGALKSLSSQFQPLENLCKSETQEPQAFHERDGKLVAEKVLTPKQEIIECVASAAMISPGRLPPSGQIVEEALGGSVASEDLVITAVVGNWGGETGGTLFVSKGCGIIIVNREHNNMSGDVLGEWGKALWEEVRELVFLAFILGGKKYLETDSWSLGLQFTSWTVLTAAYGNEERKGER
ncbi:hypothetical protein HPG69_003781 [Diceros bicornis minor]|uniref:SCAN box domain-containing protein n=1 Tax=Diceros bicornis minor TaxID=77932 RepID=A0A7J7ETY3_DICBM|nr:hypothetical protein HPG69_003781 [Diceros bicornis minor]